MQNKFKDKPAQTDETLNRIIKTITNKFLKSTSFRLLDNVCSDDSPKAGRYFYLLILVLSILLSSYYTILLYKKWTSSPVIITISSEETSIRSIPFPAITICNSNQAKRTVAESFKRESSDYLRLRTICNIDGYHTGSPSEWPSYREFILKVSQSCEEMILSCHYGSVPQNCSIIFEPILTDAGFCCTFNNLHPDFIFTDFSKDKILDKYHAGDKIGVPFTAEDGYEESLPEHYFPRKGLGQHFWLEYNDYWYRSFARGVRTPPVLMYMDVNVKGIQHFITGTGIQLGFTIVLNVSLNEYICSSSRSAGFKILLHSPSESPKIANYGNLIPAKMETRVLIKPGYRKTAEAVRSVPVKKRHCLYNNESELKYFRIYSSNNCEYECTSNLMADECGCVPLDLPRSSNETAVCGLKEAWCTQQIRREVEDLLNSSRRCRQCLPSCVYLTYTPILSYSRLLEKDSTLDRWILNEYNVSELAVVHFFYQSEKFQATAMECYLGFVNFFSNSGGIFSLFLGFSILSLIELCYLLALILSKIFKKSATKEILDKGQSTAGKTIIINNIRYERNLEIARKKLDCF